jgi:hypothetical protein
MLRLISIACLLALVVCDANTALAQGVFRPPPRPITPPVLHGPVVPLPMPKLDNNLTVKPVVPIPPPIPEAAQPDASMCCPCRGTNECSDVCCTRQ